MSPALAAAVATGDVDVPASDVEDAAGWPHPAAISAHATPATAARHHASRPGRERPVSAAAPARSPATVPAAPAR